MSSLAGLSMIEPAHRWKARPSTRTMMKVPGSSGSGSSKSLTYAKRELAMAKEQCFGVVLTIGSRSSQIQRSGVRPPHLRSLKAPFLAGIYLALAFRPRSCL
jgi:hypothetical protein